MNLELIPDTDILEPLILWPGSEWKLEDLMAHVLEAGVDHPLLQLRSRTGVTAVLGIGFDAQVVPFSHGAVWRQGVIVRVVRDVPVLKLGPTAGFGVSVVTYY